ncbi:Alpha/Beta hydrolase protein [Mycena crocata]|nr:Alpha/Beta hydrolase protein [Mycena crocata]
MSVQSTSKYGELHWTEILGMLAALIPFPAALIWNVVTTAHAPHNKHRSLKRIAAGSILRYLTSHLSVHQLQFAFGTTLGTYTQWTKQNKLPVVIEELGDDARLLWIGPKRLKRVVYLSHGGGYLLPVTDFFLSFWRYVQLELEKQKIEVGFVMLNYSLVPLAGFPTQLKQSELALEFLFAAGVKPQNLQLVGDSAGANLLLQVLSQILHPRESVPEMRIAAPFRGLLLISPWTNMSTDTNSHTENEGIDYLGHHVFVEWGRGVLAPVSEVDRAFIEPSHAPESWFKGVDRLVDRVLVTAGGAEFLRDDIVEFAEIFKKHHSHAELVVQEGGLHEDLFLDFMVGESELSSLTPLTLEWLVAGTTT